MHVVYLCDLPCAFSLAGLYVYSQALYAAVTDWGWHNMVYCQPFKISHIAQIIDLHPDKILYSCAGELLSKKWV